MPWLVGPLLGVPVGLAVFLLEVRLSAWWMKRFRFGPAEWAWRTLTYGRLQPMRLQRGVVVPGARHAAAVPARQEGAS